MGSGNEDIEMARITQPMKAVAPKEIDRRIIPLDFCPICESNAIKMALEFKSKIRRIIHAKCFEEMYIQMLTPESPLRQSKEK